MLLIFTHSGDATAGILESLLQKVGGRYVRLDTDSVCGPDGVSAGFSEFRPHLRIGGHRLRPEDLSSVWYRRPKPLTCDVGDDEGERRFVADEFAAAIEGFLSQVPPERWVNHPTRNAFASNKPRQLSVAKELGAAVPRTLVTQSPEEARTFASTVGDVVTKPLWAGSVERQDGRDSTIYTARIGDGSGTDFGRVANCPTLFQEYVKKSHDVRLTVIDGRLHAVSLKAAGADGAQRCDIRRDDMRDVVYTPVAVPPQVEGFVARLMARFGLRFGAFDFAVTAAGEWWFLEINPNGQWAWQDQAGVSDIAGSLVEAFGAFGSAA